MRDPQMPELHAVAVVAPDQPLPLKQQALLFDKVHLIRPDAKVFEKWFEKDADATFAAIDFLQDRGVVECRSPLDLIKAVSAASMDEGKKKQRADLLSAAATDLLLKKFPLLLRNFKPSLLRASVRGSKEPLWKDEQLHITPETQRHLFDFYIRLFAARLMHSSQIETVPICWDELSDSLPAEGRGLGANFQDVLHISFDYFPIPDDTWGWEEILDFKAELKNKQWDFRHFLTTLATQPQTEKQVREQIEYSLRQYELAMERHAKKSTHSFVDVFIVTPIKILEDIAKFKWSAILKGGMAAKKRKIELLEAEATAPGRECAYVFDARKRFSRSSR